LNYKTLGVQAVSVRDNICIPIDILMKFEDSLPHSTSRMLEASPTEGDPANNFRLQSFQAHFFIKFQILTYDLLTRTSKSQNIVTLFSDYRSGLDG
jgi:hypothetical protein